MKLKELFAKAIQTGIENDPRGRDIVMRELAERKKDFDKLDAKEKPYFDITSLENPYPDSRMLFATGDEEIKGAIVGIDMEVGEVMLAHALRQKGELIDVIIAHHPEGLAYARLHEVMRMQADILGRFGVPIHAAEGTLEKRMGEVERKVLPVNHTRAVDAAKLMGIPMINLHTPADNMVSSYLQRLFDDKKPHNLDDVVELILEIPEYQEAKRGGAGPKILLGSGKRKAGKVFVDMTGGTEGAKEVFESITHSGINTIVGMHFSEDHRKEAEKFHLNMIIAGHISSDNLGLNLLFDTAWGAAGPRIYDASGFRRVSRLK